MQVVVSLSNRGPMMQSCERGYWRYHQSLWLTSDISFIIAEKKMYKVLYEKVCSITVCCQSELHNTRTIKRLTLQKHVICPDQEYTK